MEWLTLLLLVPAIVVPVVLVLGFAGCDWVFLEERESPTFEMAFTETLTNNQGRQNRCIVQRIEPARLFNSGTQVAITIRSSATANLVIDKIYISQAADSGDPSRDPYDPAEDRTEVITEPVLVPQDTAKTLPAVTYTLEREKPLLIAFDIGSPGGVRFSSAVVDTEAVAFVGPGGEAGLPDRQPPPAYETLSRIYLVERIDVA